MYSKTDLGLKLLSNSAGIVTQAIQEFSRVKGDVHFMAAKYLLQQGTIIVLTSVLNSV